MSDKKYFHRLVITGLILIFLAVTFFLFQGFLRKENKNFWGNEIKKIRIGENIFQAEIAATPAKRNQGLSGRENLCENCARLFLFSEKGRQAFWMKEMKFDLDIIWIDSDNVVYIAKNVSHEKERDLIKPDREADKVLEINAGLADKLGIKIGDKIEF